MHRQSWQRESLPITPSPRGRSLMGLCIHTLPIEATAAFNMHQIFKASSVLKTHTHTFRQTPLRTHFSHPLSHKCQYRKQNAGTSPSLAFHRCVSVVPPTHTPFLVKGNCLSELLEDIVNHFSKCYHLLFFTWCAN